METTYPVSDKLIGDKETEIQTLKLEVDELTNRLKQYGRVVTNNIPDVDKKNEIDSWDQEYKKFTSSSKFDDFGKLLVQITIGSKIVQYGISYETLSYYQSIDLIKRSSVENVFELTRKGGYFSKLYNTSKYEPATE